MPNIKFINTMMIIPFVLLLKPSFPFKAMIVLLLQNLLISVNVFLYYLNPSIWLCFFYVCLFAVSPLFLLFLFSFQKSSKTNISLSLKQNKKKKKINCLILLICLLLLLLVRFDLIFLIFPSRKIENRTNKSKKTKSTTQITQKRTRITIYFVSTLWAVHLKKTNHSFESVSAAENSINVDRSEHIPMARQSQDPRCCW